MSPIFMDLLKAQRLIGELSGLLQGITADNRELLHKEVLANVDTLILKIKEYEVTNNCFNYLKDKDIELWKNTNV